jgi:hypothetical protein
MSLLILVVDGAELANASSLLLGSPPPADNVVRPERFTG